MSVDYLEAVDASPRWTETTERMRTRRALAEQVNSALPRDEQETGLSFFADSDQARLTSYRPSIVRSVLRHEYARLEWVFARPPDSHGRRVDFPFPTASVEGLVNIEGVCASVPIGPLSVKRAPRVDDRHSAVVSTPKQASAVADVFADSSRGADE